MPDTLPEALWLIAVGLGPVLLGVLIVYEILRRRRLTASERNERTKKTREIYKQSGER